MGLFSRKKLSPEELEEKSRKEKEWAQKCYQAGERFGEKIELGKKVERINDFGNKYPKTFFSIAFGVIIISFFLNLFLPSLGNVFEDASEDIRAASLGADNSKEELNQELQSLYNEFNLLEKKLEKKFLQDSLNRNDSIEILQICKRMEQIQNIFEGEKQTTGIVPDVSSQELEAEKVRIVEKMSELAMKTVWSSTDSLEVQSMTNRLEAINQLLDNNNQEKGGTNEKD